jgi:hypothetical protein
MRLEDHSYSPPRRSRHSLSREQRAAAGSRMVGGGWIDVEFRFVADLIGAGAGGRLCRLRPAR